jgi:hypothetical protein
MNRGYPFRNVALFVAVVFVAAAFSACRGNRAGNVKAEEKEAADMGRIIGEYIAAITPAK